MTWVIKDNTENEILQQLEKESDRAAAIIAATIIEDRLQDAIIAHFHEDEKILQLMFRVGGPMGNFATKIDLGFLIGVYGKDAYRSLVTIKDIRNEFAHQIRSKDFTTQKVSALIANLNFVEKFIGKNLAEIMGYGAMNQSTLIVYTKPPENPRVRFLMACQILIMQLRGASNPPDSRLPFRPFF